MGGQLSTPEVGELGSVGQPSTIEPSEPVSGQFNRLSRLMARPNMVKLAAVLALTGPVAVAPQGSATPPKAELVFATQDGNSSADITLPALTLPRFDLKFTDKDCKPNGKAGVRGFYLKPLDPKIHIAPDPVVDGIGEIEDTHFDLGSFKQKGPGQILLGDAHFGEIKDGEPADPGTINLPAGKYRASVFTTGEKCTSIHIPIISGLKRSRTVTTKTPVKTQYNYQEFSTTHSPELPDGGLATPIPLQVNKKTLVLDVMYDHRTYHDDTGIGNRDDGWFVRTCIDPTTEPPLPVAWAPNTVVPYYPLSQPSPDGCYNDDTHGPLDGELGHMGATSYSPHLEPLEEYAVDYEAFFPNTIDTGTQYAKGWKIFYGNTPTKRVLQLALVGWAADVG